jgi:coproporphyrinogen III oxidase
VEFFVEKKNPYVPTIHFNYRYFEATDSTGYSEWWFGGGTDLTPIYLNENDTIHFHRQLKQACDSFSTTFYNETKTKCDKYFYIAHRKEHRGVGGVFFDDLDAPDKESVFSLIKALGDAVLPSYVPIIKNNMNKEYGKQEREWQLIRRGRYVEFNLVYDRGTKFGLQMPNSPVESILMTLPLNAVSFSLFVY